MVDSTSILTIILKSILIGFGFVVPVLSLFRTSNLKKLFVQDLFKLTAIQAVRIAGILYVVLYILDSYLVYKQQNAAMPEMYTIENKLFGPYWPMYWFSPIMYLLLTQLFWLKKMYIKKAALITIGILLLILPSQRFLLAVTSFYRDYLPANWSMINIGSMLIEFGLNIVIFIFIIFTIILASGKLKKLSH